MKNKLRRNGFLIAAVVTLFVGIFYGLGKFDSFENRSIDVRFRIRGQIPPTAPVVIAAIDEESLDTIGKWPWPRKVHAKLIDEFRKSGSSVVVYDVMFLEPDRYDPSNDRALVQAIKRHGKVVSASAFEFVDEEIVQSNDRGETEAATQYSVNKNDPIPSIAAASARLGFVNAWTDPDGYLRYASLSYDYGGEKYYSLNLQAVSLLTGKDPEEIIAGQPSIDEVMWDYPSKKVLINWKSVDKERFEIHSCAKILDPNIPQDWKDAWLKDKIIIVGSVALGLYDHYPTAHAPSVAGLYLHANAIDNLLSRQFLLQLRGSLKPAYRNMTYFLIALLGFLGCFLVFGPNVWIGVVATTVLLVGYWALGYFLMVKSRVCIELAAPSSALFFSYIAVFFYRFIVEQREKAGIKKAFGVYVNPHVVDQIAKNPDALKLGGEMRDMTVMFSDIAGFTTISEKLSPQELVSLLNIYLTAMTDTIMRFDGTVDKYEGDAIMAFWGAPLEQPKHARQACLAVLENRERLKQLNVELEQKGMNKLFARCGLNTGPMNVGNMGSSQKFNYTVMGDTVNLASRLEGANKEYGSALMVSESTYSAAKDDIEVRELDLLRVKGKKIPIKVYELVCLKGQLTDAQKKGFEVYLEGLELYRNRKFKEALKRFESVNEFLKDDPPAATYIGRCKDYLENPPGKDWDGVHVMTTK